MQPIRNSAPFWFVLERLKPRHQLTFLWFEGYYTVVPDELGNLIREPATRAEVEALIGKPLDE